MDKSVVYTIGYGGRSLEDFLRILKHYSIERVVDVRRWNKSVKLPEFSGKNLAETLPANNVEYRWSPELGGFRKFNVDVEDYGVARCFKSPGFRAYATYIIVSPKVKPYLKELIDLVSTATSAILCSEKYPWLCHRKILADYLVAKEFRVVHVLSFQKHYTHKMSKCAKVVEGELKYS